MCAQQNIIWRKARCETEDHKFRLYATWTRRKDPSCLRKNEERKRKESSNLPLQMNVQKAWKGLKNRALHWPSHRWWSLGGSKESSRTQYLRSGGATPVCHLQVDSMPSTWDKQGNKTNPQLPAEVLCQQRSRTLPLKVLCLPRLSCAGHTSPANRSAIQSAIHPFSQPAVLSNWPNKL